MTLQPRHERALIELTRRPELSTVMLVKLTEWFRGTANGSLNDLMKAGLAERVAPARYRITDAGRALARTGFRY